MKSKGMSWVLLGLLALVPALLPAVALGQSADGTGGAKSPAGETKEDLRSQLDKDLESYWGKRRKVAVIQKRKFAKPGRFEIDLFGGAVPNDAYVNYLALGAHFTYHLSEFFGLELSGAWLKGFNTNLSDGIKSAVAGTNQTFNIIQLEKLSAVAHLSAVFSFIHGKISILKTNLSHFDLYMLAGGGISVYSASEQAPTVATGGLRALGNVGLGFKFFLNNWFGLRLEYRQYITKNTDGIANPSLLSLGVGFFTKGSEG
ncbi:MAG: outer membrane beta-barrel domain-containing protein [Deltaproteobacteria bacterium]|nr:outer membrane beta-barrel domain-containing protein [Deltaproteobacteria bacterium]